MSFIEVLTKTNISQIADSIYHTSEQDVKQILAKNHFSISDFPVLISPDAAPFLEKMATIARSITLLRFGKAMRLYAPLYVSNECVNACVYCGFNIRNTLKRRTLTKAEALTEAARLHAEGFRHILLVSGEHRDKVPLAYFESLAAELSQKFAAISIEVYPMDTKEYQRLAQCGVSGIAIYQETYNRTLYKTFHKGPKADFIYRLTAPERAAEAGFRELGLGALLGLNDFRIDMTCTALHAVYLMKKFWKAHIAISFPRLRKAAGAYTPPAPVSERELAQIIFALRMVLPDVDLVLSTRERSVFRNGMAGAGITRMSAGSKTNPGGYALKENSLEQFEVADTRPSAEVASMLQKKNIEPVWKDFDRSFLSGSS